MHVLVVDDDPQIQSLYRYYLEREGFEVSVGGDGEQALDLLASSYFDLAIFDLLLPRLHGLKVLARLRESERPERRASVIVVTGVLMREPYRQEAMRLGADAFFTKPVDMDELIAAARRLVASRAVAS